MATFSTVDELVRILDADPQMTEALRARVLTRELLVLPETVARLTERIDEFSAATTARFEQSDRRIDALEQHMEKHFEELDKRMDALDKRMNALDSRMATLDQRIAILRGSVDLLQQRLEAFEKSVDTRFDILEKRVDVLEKQIAELTKRVQLLEKRLEAFEKSVNERFDKVDERFVKVDERFDKVDERFSKVDDRFDKIDERFDALEERVDDLDRRTERRFQRVFDDLSVLRAAHARNAAREQSPAIVEDMGFQWTRNLKVNDILKMIAGADTSDIPRNLMRRFRRADLFAEATDAQGETCYVAVEVSYTADERDTDRAIAFASYLNRFTRRPAYPAVASLRLDSRIEGIVESGSVFWYEMLPEDLQVE